jgi:hypothetical protein
MSGPHSICMRRVEAIRSTGDETATTETCSISILVNMNAHVVRNPERSHWNTYFSPFRFLTERFAYCMTCLNRIAVYESTFTVKTAFSTVPGQAENHSKSFSVLISITGSVCRRRHIVSKNEEQYRSTNPSTPTIELVSFISAP